MHRAGVSSKVVVIVILLGLLCCVLFMPCRRRGVREASPEVSCRWNLEFLAKGIKNYRTAHGRLPQVFVGPNGHDHSWRVMIAGGTGS